MPEHNHSRRAVLRGLLATGCVLCLPRFGQAQPQGGIGKAQAQYQNQPKGDQKCDLCLHFVAPDTCHLVEGKISPEGWCMFWTQKTDGGVHP